MIDLHTHTTASDGTDSPSQLINKALSSGLITLGITDHDSTGGWSEAISALRPGLELVLGAEISALTIDGTSVHMLGLLFDGEDQAMQSMLADSRDTRIPRMRKMIELLAADGIAISMEDVMANVPVGATLGRPHLADALVKNRVVASRDDAFHDLLHNNSKYYVTHVAPTPEEAIHQINQAGGVAVIAHPFASRRGEVISADSFTSLITAGLHGIEIDHRDHSLAERIQLSEIADQLGLVKTGSSDYHGTGKLNALGENLTDPGQWEKLESLASARRVIRK
ncbi:MAG: PHP domain-containing protein [Candidatus Planktophila sp.]